MASAQAKNAEQDGEEQLPGDAASPPRRSRKKLFVIVGIVAVIGSCIGVAYTTGTIQKLLGKHDNSTEAIAQGGSIDLPDIIANLNTGTRKTAFIRMKTRLELGSKADEAAATAATPRLLDLFQTYLRDMRPEELRGSAGTYRLRQELMARANIVLAPAKVAEILFVELLVQ